MAPTKKQEPPFHKDERVLCFHMEMLYEAKIMDVRAAETGDEWQYKIHYKGWKSSWDDWVPQDRVRKFTDDNKDLASQLLAQFKHLQSGKAGKQTGKKGKVNTPDLNTNSARVSEERTAGTATHFGRGPRRVRDFDLEPEDTFHSRPSIQIHTPDHMKAILVDDWENVTKNQQIVPLPHAHSVDKILDNYLAYEMRNRVPGSAHAQVLEEVVDGIRMYFDKSLGRILLYRFERPQYLELHKQWQCEGSEHKSPKDTYGAEHLARLLVSLPELIAQTNMDQQSVNRLREELVKFTNWLGRKTTVYFVNEYETPNQEYIDQARSA